MVVAMRPPAADADQAPALDTWRCGRCGRILAKLRLAPGSRIEIKCGSCNSFSDKTVERESQKW